jgi:adenylosuccinate lyase
MELVKCGASRQAMHEVIRSHSMTAWAAVRAGQANPLTELLSRDERITHLIAAERVRSLLDATGYVGDAPARAREMARTVGGRLAAHP